MANDLVHSSRDWLRSPRTYLLVWKIPPGVILLGSKLIWWSTERAWGKFS